PEKEGLVNAAMGDSGGRIIGRKSTMAGMARMLVIFLKRPVIDRTGLAGYYDFDVKWSAPPSADGQPPAAGFGAAGSGMLISTLQDQFGLRLVNSKGPVKYWVTDHVEPPTEN
ncbi:MAG TPA: TIGR03435 family protein, partial [Bryobacteraceae bacterium]